MRPDEAPEPVSARMTPHPAASSAATCLLALQPGLLVFQTRDLHGFRVDGVLIAVGILQCLEFGKKVGGLAAFDLFRSPQHAPGRTVGIVQVYRLEDIGADQPDDLHSHQPVGLVLEGGLGLHGLVPVLPDLADDLPDRLEVGARGIGDASCRTLSCVLAVAHRQPLSFQTTPPGVPAGLAQSSLSVMVNLIRPRSGWTV